MATLSRRATFAGGLWDVAALVFPLFTTLLLSVVIARQLGSSALGEQSLIAYVASLVASVVIFAASSCAIQVMASSHGREDAAQLASLGRLSRRVHLVTGVLAGLGIASVATFRPEPMAWVLMGLVTLIDAVGWSYGTSLIARHGWRAVSPLRLVSQTVAALLSVAALLAGGGLAWIFAVQVLVSLSLAWVLRERDRRDSGPGAAALSRAELRPLIRLWLLFVLSMLLSQIVDKRMELLFLAAFGSAHEVAVYAVAFSLVTVAVTIPSSLAGAAIPGIAAAGAADAGAGLAGHLRRASRLATMAACLLTAALIVLGPSAVVLFWGAALQDAADVLPWMAISVLFVPIRVLYNAYWTGVGRLAPVLATGGVGAVVDLVAAALLVPAFGIAGAVVANVAAQVVTCGLLVAHTRRQVVGRGAAGGQLLRSAAVSVLAGGTAWLAAAAVGGGPLLTLVLGALTFLVVVLAVGLAVGLVSFEDADWLVSTLPGAVGPVLVFFGGHRWAASRRTLVPTG